MLELWSARRTYKLKFPNESTRDKSSGYPRHGTTLFTSPGATVRFLPDTDMVSLRY